ncbi:anaerobic ribonucleoside-triphosphate reductase activating protein [Patescibacteria group bacterium]|nr:anaerobic ribonucleoside-triphosphate reductase activating protein [Patescibacteria group bacterium]
MVITGGEPTLQPDLPEFIKQIRNLGFKVKLDTNGSNSIMLKQLIDHKLIDYIAMDVKAPLEKYHLIVGKKINTSQVKQSIKHIIASGIDHEFRTTYVDHLLSLNDIKDIIKLLSGARKYYLQNYVDNQNVLNHLNSQPLNLNWQIELSKLFSGSIGVR